MRGTGRPVPPAWLARRHHRQQVVHYGDITLRVPIQFVMPSQGTDKQDNRIPKTLAIGLPTAASLHVIQLHEKPSDRSGDQNTGDGQNGCGYWRLQPWFSA
jgi:hypothetical protein